MVQWQKEKLGVVGWGGITELSSLFSILSCSSCSHINTSQGTEEGRKRKHLWFLDPIKKDGMFIHLSVYQQSIFFLTSILSIYLQYVSIHIFWTLLQGLWDINQKENVSNQSKKERQNNANFDTQPQKSQNITKPLKRTQKTPWLFNVLSAPGEWNALSTVSEMMLSWESFLLITIVNWTLCVKLKISVSLRQMVRSVNCNLSKMENVDWLWTPDTDGQWHVGEYESKRTATRLHICKWLEKNKHKHIYCA